MNLQVLIYELWFLQVFFVGQESVLSMRTQLQQQNPNEAETFQITKRRKTKKMLKIFFFVRVTEITTVSCAVIFCPNF